MKKQSHYKTAKILNLVTLILTIVFIVFTGVFLFLASSYEPLYLYVATYMLPIMACFLIAPIIAHVTLKKEIKNGCRNNHTGLAICLIIFTGLLGIIAGVLILVGDGETSSFSTATDSGNNDSGNNDSGYLDF